MRDDAVKNAFLKPRPFLQIPGPNPILMCGTKGAWDENCIEACDAIKNFETYYLYYHGVPKDKEKWGPGGYKVGLATAPHPLGPWTKYGNEPVLPLGPKGSWDDECTACAAILREKPDKFLMFYSGRGGVDAQGKRPPGHTTKWHIGLATAPKPEGPWTKYEKNPVLSDFGYVGGIVKLAGKYYLYTTHPLNSTAPDYAPICLATADAPEGPWKIWEGNPVVPAGEKGAWDDGGFSEAKVTYWDGVFHVFYGGAKEYVPRGLTRESIGYAYSHDGFHFIKYGGNPVAAREADPNMAAFAELHTLFEPPFIYAYHTIRYIDGKLAPFAAQRTTTWEDLGVQVLVMQTPFRLPMCVLTRESLNAGEATELCDCPAASLNGVSQAGLTVECEFDAGAHEGIRVRVRSSADGLGYDTDDLFTINCDCRPGMVARKTVPVNTSVRFVKVIVENLDKTCACKKVKVTATLGG
jgi:hypothetical protein